MKLSLFTAFLTFAILAFNVEGYSHFTPNKVGEDLKFNIPIINAVSLCSEYPNFHFEGRSELFVRRDKGERTCRILINFNTSSYVPTVDKGFDATLTLNTVNSFGNPSRRFSVYPISLRGNIDGSTWNSEYDTKLTGIQVGDVVMSNAFADPDNGIRWGGGFFSNPKPGYNERLKQGVLTFDVAHILESGVTGMLVTYDDESKGSSDESFQGLEAQNPPSIKVVRRQLLDDIDQWPENLNCHSEFRTVVAPHSGLELIGHAYFCEATTEEGREHNCVIGTGVPWYADLNGNRFARLAGELREECNLIFPNLLCSGQEGAASSCPDNKTDSNPNGFGYGIHNEELLWFAEWFFGADPLIPPHQNVDFFIAWDRFGPMAMTMKMYYPNRWIGGIEADAWFRSFACGPEGASIPHGRPGHCNPYGYIFERCLFWDTELNECIVQFPGFSIVDCIARTENCSRCLGDFNEQYSAKTRWWVNTTRVNDAWAGLEEDASFDIRQSCYALDGLQNMEPFGFTNFAPGIAWGTYFNLTDKELHFSTYRRLEAPPGENFVILEKHYPDVLTMQAVPEGTFDQPFGETGRDTAQAQVFVDAVEFRKISGETVMFLQPYLDLVELSVNTGHFLIAGVDPGYVQSDAFPTASVIYIPNNSGHAFSFVSPQFANRLGVEYMREVLPQVLAQREGYLQVDLN